MLDMREMFFGCTAFNGDLSEWDVSQVTNMIGMFYGCSAFNFRIESWNPESLKMVLK